MNSLMASRSSGSSDGHSVISTLSFISAVTGAVFGGVTGGSAFSRFLLSWCVHIVLSSMQMMFSASIGVDGMVTGTVGDGVVLFRIGDGGDGRFVIPVG